MLISFTTGAAQICIMFSQNDLRETGKYSNNSSRSLRTYVLNDTMYLILQVSLNQNKTLIIRCKRKVAKTL